MDKILLSQQTMLISILIGLFFIWLGYLNNKKIFNNKNYIVGDRDENTFSLTSSLTTSALGAWILFGPPSAATWGGIGAVIGYALGTAAPMLFLYNFGPKIRKEFPNGLTLTEFIQKRFGQTILKLSLFLILFYLIIFLIAEGDGYSIFIKLYFKNSIMGYRRFNLNHLFTLCIKRVLNFQLLPTNISLFL